MFELMGVKCNNKMFIVLTMKVNYNSFCLYNDNFVYFCINKNCIPRSEYFFCIQTFKIYTSIAPNIQERKSHRKYRLGTVSNNYCGGSGRGGGVKPVLLVPNLHPQLRRVYTI